MIYLDILRRQEEVVAAVALHAARGHETNTALSSGNSQVWRTRSYEEVNLLIGVRVAWANRYEDQLFAAPGGARAPS